MYPRLSEHVGHLHELTSYGILVQVFGLTLSFLRNRCLRVVPYRRFSQEYAVNVGVPRRSIHVPTLSLPYINDLPDDVIYNIAICDSTTLHYKSEQVSELW